MALSTPKPITPDEVRFWASIQELLTLKPEKDDYRLGWTEFQKMLNKGARRSG